MFYLCVNCLPTLWNPKPQPSFFFSSRWYISLNCPIWGQRPARGLIPLLSLLFLPLPPSSLDSSIAPMWPLGLGSVLLRGCLRSCFVTKLNTHVTAILPLNSTRHYSNCSKYVDSFIPCNNSFYMWRNRHREVKWLAQDHIARKWQSQNLNPSSIAPGSILSTVSSYRGTLSRVYPRHLP